MSAIRMLKGHGTGNDFVVIPDHDGELSVTAAQVRLLCDRRRGIGGDGVLRVVRTQADPQARAIAAADPLAAGAEWFMDYRNADGSIAEMCGNGVRVFAEYLSRERLVGPAFDVLTRGGVRHVRRPGRGPEGWTVDMGGAHLLATAPMVSIEQGQERAALAAVEIPNPHVVVRLGDQGELAALDLSAPPVVRPALPHGQNVEFVVLVGARALAMRVHERGVGETLSCGTGICAAVVAAAGAQTSDAPGAASDSTHADQTWTVDVPGGRCWVDLLADGSVLLTGPAVLVAELAVDPDWLERAAVPC